MDVRLEQDLSIAIAGGDFDLSATEGQNVFLNLVADRGQYRQSPNIGAGIGNTLKSKPSITRVSALAEAALKLDAIEVGDVELKNKQITVYGSRQK